jgi:hypothetical protein
MTVGVEKQSDGTASDFGCLLLMACPLDWN